MNQVRLQYSRGAPMMRSMREALSDALKDLELPKSAAQVEKEIVRNLSRQSTLKACHGLWTAPLLVDIVRSGQECYSLTCGLACAGWRGAAAALDAITVTLRRPHPVALSCGSHGSGLHAHL